MQGAGTTVDVPNVLLTEAASAGVADSRGVNQGLDSIRRASQGFSSLLWWGDLDRGIIVVGDREIGDHPHLKWGKRVRRDPLRQVGRHVPQAGRRPKLPKVAGETVDP